MSQTTPFRTRIKFCGMTRPGDVRLAGELGVDSVGFVFVPGSPREVQPQEARAMRQALAPMVDSVALFRNAGTAQVREVVRQLRPTLLQFHGDEDDAFCRSFGTPWIKAVPMGDTVATGPDARALQLLYPAAAALLFDSHVAGGDGGSGRSFDWSRIPPELLKPAVIAGGLNPDNVARAVRTVRPWGVDVCSGIELEPGVKDGERMRAFVSAVRAADCVDVVKDSDTIDHCHVCGR
ncbi:MAG: phosphoribosylanthranilate isomerase [Pseudoxanthomonas suwonensis]|nr:phosphoribosylanthranilate isomerase [Pseudoxanthomonas suwonensis]